MSDTKLEKLIERLREKLSQDSVPDDITGSVTLNLQSGGLSGKVEIRQNV